MASKASKPTPAKEAEHIVHKIKSNFPYFSAFTRYFHHERHATPKSIINIAPNKYPHSKTHYNNGKNTFYHNYCI